MRSRNGSVHQTMSLEPLKTALSANDVGETSLALPSDRGARSAQQRVLEQVSTIKRTKSKYRSKSASFSPTSPSFDTIDNKLFSPSNGLEGSANGFIKSKKSIKSTSSWGSTVQRNQNFPVFPSLPRSNGTINHKPAIERTFTIPPLRNGSYYPSNGIPSPTKNANLVPKFGAKGGSDINGKNEEKRGPEITLKEAVDCLISTDETYQICGASFIQHCTFTNENSKKEVLKLGGIPSLVALMGSPSLQVQETSAAALRNLVFKDLDSKEAVDQCGGVAQAVQLLGKTDSAETQKHVTGLLWNLSSADKVKPALLRSALPVLTKSVLQPFSAKINQNDKPHLDAEIFYNATGCLRNLSCGKPASRKAMRKCEGLVDSIFTYVQNCVSTGDTNNKSLENCVCVLHNLTYQLETESPEVFSRINALATSRDNENTSNTDTSPISCFSSQSRKIQQESHFDYPVMEDNNPKGQNWLIHSQALQSFLTLMGTSENVAVREACCGALQNLTAPKGLVGEVLGQNIVQKLNGLRHISPLLDNSSIKNNAISLLGNLSRNPGLQSNIAREALPQLSHAVTSSMGTDLSPDNDLTMATACNTLSSLMRANPELAKPCLNKTLINSLNDLSKNKSLPNSSKAAGVLLHCLWSDKSVQSVLRKIGLNKKSFVNDVTSAAIRSVQVIE